MKYILTTAAIALCIGASAQGRVRLVHTAQAVNVSTTAAAATHPYTAFDAVLDRLQAESESTVVYPLLTMTKKALAKAQALPHRPKHARKHRTIGPNRA